MTLPMRPDPVQVEAVEAARDFIAARSRGDWHAVASVVLTETGERYLAINLDSILPRASVCAEPIAIGMAMAADPENRVTFCAAVNRHGRVIPPCGACRELMLDYGAEAAVAIPEGESFVAVPMRELVPSAYKHDRRKS